MKINIFFCNGAMSALASCLISDHLTKENPDDEFILCIEQNGHVLPSYYEVVDLLVQQNQQFKKIIRAHVEFKTLSLKRPLKFFQSFFLNKKIAKNVKEKIGNNMLGIERILWAPSTSRLWHFFKIPSSTRLHIIEHGLGEYIFAMQSKKPSWRKNASRFLANFICYPQLSSFTEIWLCSHAVILQNSKKIVQKNFGNEFLQYVDKFWMGFKDLFPLANQEFESIMLRIKSHKGPIYLYFPSDEVKIEAQSQFIKKQMKYLNIQSNALFIVKNHPSDISYPFWRLLEPYGECINIKNEINCYVPVEFIAVYLGIKDIIGSASSALYYLKSWVPEIIIHVYNDYEKPMLTDASKFIQEHFRAANLLK